MKFTYRGLMAPVFTPFKEDMTLNLEIIRAYAEFLNEKGVKGVLVNGTTGEGPALSKEERMAIAETWKEAVGLTKQHLMIQVGGAPLPDVIQLSKHAELIGADSILCLPELYFKPINNKELIDHLKKVGTAAPRTPLLYYHIPSFSNVNLNMGSLLNDITDEVPTFCGIKFTSTCLDEGLSAIEAKDGKYAVFLGADTVLSGALTLGYDSAIVTTLNFMPTICNNILHAINYSDVKTSRELQNRFNLIIRTITAFGTWVPSMKSAMNILSPINVGRAREPLVNTSDEDMQNLKEKLKSLNVQC